MSEKKMRPLTPKQWAILVVIGLCAGFVMLFLSLAMLSAVHEGIRVEGGKGDSWRFALSFTCLNPVAVAVTVCCALRAWKEFDIPDADDEEQPQ